MSRARTHRRKVLKARRRLESGLPLRKWEQDRLARDQEGQPQAAGSLTDFLRTVVG